MITVGEIDKHGEIVGIFHRTATGSWTHAPGEKGRYWGGRHGEALRWLELDCPCGPKALPRIKVAHPDADEAGDGPGAVAADRGVRRRAAAGG